MVNIAWSVDVRATRIESEMPKLIYWAIYDALFIFISQLVVFQNNLTLYGENLENLTAKMKSREKKRVAQPI